MVMTSALFNICSKILHVAERPVKMHCKQPGLCNPSAIKDWQTPRLKSANLMCRGVLQAKSRAPGVRWRLLAKGLLARRAVWLPL